ncbi:HAD family hydrolase [Roseibacterium sp. SDUM158017]|uniref:sulfotransferase-like domain-containing protein n=1 Tax=Roseicyclus salinarum TaxID=3036773 RepID=UPI0024158504|nr:HAD family hydrolase [Roseibacterium sp. SDUM158017]MDG4647087.1 HAD family hydrolase [Roseibacterium sp. SDUM158017]
MKIAMWSGPRNLSTAMMYAFAARGDCAVWDEPFYAAWLTATGGPHPMASRIVATHDSDPATVAARCDGPPPDGMAHFYMKHMPHHMSADFPLGWAGGCVNAHLIRHPARVLASYAAKREAVSFDDIGFAAQAEFFERFPGPVIDSADIRRDPRDTLSRFCAEIGLPFTERMLSWPPGPKPFDGVWAAHWYGAVHRSTGFAQAEGQLPPVAPEHEAIHARALPIYEALSRHAIRR